MEITTKTTAANSVEISIKCKECNFTGSTWKELTDHKWTDCSEALIQRLMMEDARSARIAQEVAQQVAQEGAREEVQEEARQEVALQDSRERERSRQGAPTPAPRSFIQQQGAENSQVTLKEQEHREEALHWWDSNECSFQAEEEFRLVRHIIEAHRITCYTCKDTFISFSEMIEHRRVNHPSTKKCNTFPECVNGDRCLYTHEGSVVSSEKVKAHSSQSHGEEVKFTCRTCQGDFNDKHEMMVHRKREHLNIVGLCKNIAAGINCRKGPENCWYRHDQLTNPRSTSRNNITAVPAFTEQNFPFGPTPQRAVVGQGNVELQLIQQTLQQQQQMTIMMTEIMKLRN